MGSFAVALDGQCRDAASNPTVLLAEGKITGDMFAKALRGDMVSATQLRQVLDGLDDEQRKSFLNKLEPSSPDILPALYKKASPVKSDALSSYFTTNMGEDVVARGVNDQAPGARFFSKKMYRIGDDTYGYNVSDVAVLNSILGPGYFKVSAGNDGSLEFDYDVSAKTFPPKPTPGGLLACVAYGGLKDEMRQLSDRVFIGQLRKNGKLDEHYFLLSFPGPKAATAEATPAATPPVCNNAATDLMVHGVFGSGDFANALTAEDLARSLNGATQEQRLAMFKTMSSSMGFKYEPILKKMFDLGTPCHLSALIPPGKGPVTAQSFGSDRFSTRVLLKRSSDGMQPDGLIVHSSEDRHMSDVLDPQFSLRQVAKNVFVVKSEGKRSVGETPWYFALVLPE